MMRLFLAWLLASILATVVASVLRFYVDGPLFSGDLDTSYIVEILIVCGAWLIATFAAIRVVNPSPAGTFAALIILYSGSLHFVSNIVFSSMKGSATAIGISLVVFLAMCVGVLIITRTRLMDLLSTSHRLLNHFSQWAVWLGGLSLLLAAFMIVIEVLGRKIGGTLVAVEIYGFSINTGITLPQFRVPGSDEYSGYVFAGATVWAYAYTLIHRSHIRIDALYNVFPGRLRAVLDVVGLALLGFYVVYVTERAWIVFIKTLEKGSKAATPQQTPLWLPQSVWVTGMTFFAIVTIFLCIYALLCLVTGRAGEVQKLAGTMSVDEEVQEETRGVKEMDG